MATTRRNSRKSVVVETVEDVTPVTAETAIVEDVTVTPVEDVTPVTDETPVDETPVVPVVTGPLVSVTIAPCGYVSQRANLGNFAVSYRHTRVERALVGTVAGVFSTEAKALKAAAQVNAGQALNPADTATLFAGSALVLPAYIVPKASLPEVRKQLTWLYAAWLYAEAEFKAGQVAEAV